MAPTTITSLQLLYHFPNPNWLPVRSFSLPERNSSRIVHLLGIQQPLSNRLSLTSHLIKHAAKQIYAVGSGFEASITDTAITLRNAKIVEESRVEDKIQLRVDLSGEETQRVFSKVLTNLARTAPPIPGFRREKGGNVCVFHSFSTNKKISFSGFHT
uniref:Retrovirus-related Pol polyprotein from transposon TNT 1-94 n=1 Tax=Rhizophora mucronata TaxID=61149 RepID=A0A2P2KMK5_RHIMU